MESNADASDLEYEESIWITDCLAEITESDILFLKKFEKDSYKQLNWFVFPQHGLIDPASVEKKVMKAYVSMKRLESKGLIAQTYIKGGGISHSSSLSDWANSVLSLSFELTLFGEKVIRFLKGSLA